MTLQNDFELSNTQTKLHELESLFRELQEDPNEDERVRELTLFSLKKLINQLTEEIARYQAGQTAKR